MTARSSAPIAYVMKRYPRLSETFILNEIRAMERLGAKINIFSLLQPEPPPHHPMVHEVQATVHALPPQVLAKAATLTTAHCALIRQAPLRYLTAFGKAILWSFSGSSPLSVWKQFVRAGFIADACQKMGIRHIHAHFANDPAVVVHFASLMSGIPFSVTAHAKDLYLTPKCVIRQRIRAATFITTCTGYNARYLRDLVEVSEQNKIHLVYHGIDLNLFNTQPVRVPRKESAFKILSVGRLVPKKGHDDLIAACQILHDSGYKISCQIVGDGPLFQELTDDIAKRGVEKVVSLVGAMTHAELVNLYGEADLFALAPRIVANGDRDGIPNVIAEAMAAGVPVVSTEVSGIPELVRHESTGLLVPPNDATALAAAIAQLLNAPAIAASLAKSARTTLKADFNYLKTTVKLHALMGCTDCSEPFGATVAGPT